jgi:hypothetical protein
VVLKLEVITMIINRSEIVDHFLLVCFIAVMKPSRSFWMRHMSECMYFYAQMMFWGISMRPSLRIEDVNRAGAMAMDP